MKTPNPSSKNDCRAVYECLRSFINNKLSRVINYPLFSFINNLKHICKPDHIAYLSHFLKKKYDYKQTYPENFHSFFYGIIKGLHPLYVR